MFRLVISGVLLTLVTTGLAGCGGEPPPQAQAPASPEPAAAGESFSRIKEDITRQYFSLVPEMATYFGVPEAISGPDLTRRLNQLAPEDESSKRASFRAMIKQLESLDKTRLSPRDAVIHSVFLTQLRSGMAAAEVVDYGSIFADYGVWFLPFPVTQLSGPQISIPGLLEKQHTVSSEADAHAYIERLQAYGVIIDQVIEKIDHDRALGVVPADFTINKAIRVIADRSAGEPAEHSLVLSFSDKLKQAGLAGDGQLVARAEALVRDTVFPANTRLTDTLKSLMSDAGSDAGIWRLPHGEELYQAMIRHMTDTTLSPRQIHDIGLAEVERITAEMDAILTSQGYLEGSVGERMSALAREQRFLYANTDEGKQKLIDDLNGQMAGIAPLLPQWFATLPEQGVVIKRVPRHAEESATGGFYDAPALDGSRPGTYWINLKDTATWPSFSLNTLTYHEANPGHHLQTAVGMGLETPILQSVLYSNAFGEGWALYSEALAKEMGLYDDDPYGDLGRLQDEIHRAIRLVVDTGMHALRWSRAEAIEYMIDNEGAHPDEAESEIDRYAVWPGQALGYKIGMLRIQELRTEAETALGDRFDIRSFHDELLKDGGVPLQVLEAKVRRWVKAHDH